MVNIVICFLNIFVFIYTLLIDRICSHNVSARVSLREIRPLSDDVENWVTVFYFGIV